MCTYCLRWECLCPPLHTIMAIRNMPSITSLVRWLSAVGCLRMLLPCNSNMVQRQQQLQACPYVIHTNVALISKSWDPKHHQVDSTLHQLGRMPPRLRAPTDPVPYWQDRFLLLQDCKLLVQKLAAVVALADFGLAHSRAVLLFNYVQHAMRVLPTEETVREIIQSSMIEHLMTATRNGLNKLDQEWESPTATCPSYLASMQVVGMLCHLVFRCSTTWSAVTVHRKTITTRLATMAVKAGKYTSTRALHQLYLDLCSLDRLNKCSYTYSRQACRRDEHL